MSAEKTGELILGTAMGYRFEHLKPFLFSLKNTGFKGDLVLFVSEVDKATYTLLYKHGVKLIPFKEEYPFTTKLKIPDGFLPEKFSSGKISVKYLRYILYFLYLLKNEGKFSKILITDVRDIIFQRNPFDFNFKNALCCFIEDSHVILKDSPFNAVRIRRHFGEDTLERIGRQHPLCSGTTYGIYSGIMKYLRKMIELIFESDTIGGGDQGLHNYLIYTEEFDDLKLYDNENGPVFTFGTKMIKSIHINSEGLITNSKGDVFNIIHQYDRHPELFKKLKIPYKVNMPIKLPYFLIKFTLSWKNRIENVKGYDFLNHLLFKFTDKLGISVALDQWRLL
ncbi:MAG: hypothetical protein ACTSQI_18010 [Candidatus Helarchaeota archaeon]